MVQIVENININININTLENDQDVIAFLDACEAFEGDHFDIDNVVTDIPIHIIVNAYVKRDEYYNLRYQNFAPNNLKFNIDKLLTYFEIDSNRIDDLERAQRDCDFRQFYSLLSVEELTFLGW